MHTIKRYKKKFNFLDESYNANPSSVENAILNFSKIKKNNSKKYLLLGDMLELGKKVELYHKNLSNIINKNDYLMIKGSNATGLNILSRKIIAGDRYAL